VSLVIGDFVILSVRPSLNFMNILKQMCLKMFVQVMMKSMNKRNEDVTISRKWPWNLLKGEFICLLYFLLVLKYCKKCHML